MIQDEDIVPIIGKQFPAVGSAMIDVATCSVDIIVYDWRWYPQDPGGPAQQFNNAIINAARRGVKIRVLTNIEYVIKVLNDNKIEAKKIRSERLVHAKMMIIDGQHLIIGSHNYTQNAFTLNLEASVLIRNCPNIARFSKFFETLFSYD